jgi:3-hydroxyacyl-[acyl-carrier-protein] dehydratase
MALLDKKAIEAIIPHRDPFLLIDEVLELEPGVRILAKKTLTGEESWFAGHFPGHPVLPGVLTVEMLAQAGAVCVLSMPEFAGKIAFFAGIENMKFRRQILPGETVMLELEIIKLRSSVGVGKATATVDGKRAVTGEISFAIGATTATQE